MASNWEKLKARHGLSDWEAVQLVAREFAKEKIGELFGAVTSPGDALAGRMDPLSAEGAARVGGLAGLLSPGPIVGAGRGAVPGAVAAAGWSKKMGKELDDFLGAPEPPKKLGLAPKPASKDWLDSLEQELEEMVQAKQAAPKAAATPIVSGAPQGKTFPQSWSPSPMGAPKIGTPVYYQGKPYYVGAYEPGGKVMLEHAPGLGSSNNFSVPYTEIKSSPLAAKPSYQPEKALTKAPLPEGMPSSFGDKPLSTSKGDVAAPSPKGEWKKTGPQKGSNPGGTYMSPEGIPHYVKFYKDDAQARGEHLAGKVLDALGIKHLRPEPKAVEGKLGVATKWNPNLVPMNKKAFENLTPSQQQQLADMYVGAALTKNWDVVGLDFDNIMKDKATGDLVQVDLGGSFKHRAQGGAKPYGSDTAELTSLLDPQYPAGQVFSKLFEKNPELLANAADKLAELDFGSLAPHFKSNGAEDIYKTLVDRAENMYHEVSGQGGALGPVLEDAILRDIHKGWQAEKTPRPTSTVEVPQGWGAAKTATPTSSAAANALEQIKKDFGLGGTTKQYWPHDKSLDSHPVMADLGTKGQGFAKELLEAKKLYGSSLLDAASDLSPFIEPRDNAAFNATFNHLAQWEGQNGPIEFAAKEPYVHPHNAAIINHPALSGENSPYGAFSLLNAIHKEKYATPEDAAWSLFQNGMISADDLHEMAPAITHLNDWAAKHGGFQFAEAPKPKPKVYGPSKPSLVGGTNAKIEAGLTPFEWQLFAPPSVTKAPPQLASLLGDTQRVVNALDLGHNLTIPLVGGKAGFKGHEIDPSLWEHKKEKAFFLAGYDPWEQALKIAKSYLPYDKKTDPSLLKVFTSNAKNPLMLDWKKTFGTPDYMPDWMRRAIDIAREREADMLMLQNMSDQGTSKLQTQFAILAPNILRYPEAAYNPLMADSANLYHAGGLPLNLFGPSLSDEEGEAPRRIIDITR